MTIGDTTAFPLHPDNTVLNENGLTKREYFAAMALSAMSIGWDDPGAKEITAKAAVEYADALIEQLNK